MKKDDKNGNYPRDNEDIYYSDNRDYLGEDPSDPGEEGGGGNSEDSDIFGFVEEESEEEQKKISASDLLAKIREHISDDYIYEKPIEHPRGAIPVGYLPEDDGGEDPDAEPEEEAESKNDSLIEQGILPDKAGSSGEEKENGLYEARQSAKLHKGEDDPDYNLMSIFGLDGDEKEETGSPERENKKREYSVPEVDISSPGEKKKLINSYRRRFVLGFFALIGTAVLLLISFVIENSGLVGIGMPAFLDFETYPKVALLLYIQVILLAIAMQYKRFFSYIHDIFIGRPGPGQIFVFLTFALIIYYIYLGTSDSIRSPMTFNALLMLAALFSVLHELMDISSQIYSLKIASSGEKKYAFVRLSQSQAEQEREMIEKYLGRHEHFLALTRTSRVSDFMNKNFSISSKRNSVKYILAFSLIFSLIFSLAVFFRSGSGSAFEYALSAFLFTTPFSLFFVFGHARYDQTRKLAAAGSTVIGEGSFDDYGAPSCVVLSDSGLFSGKGRIELIDMQGYGQMRIDTALGYAAAVFNKLRGPLSSVFLNIAADYEISGDVDIAAMHDNGIEAAVDGVQVMIGTYDFMKKVKMLPRLDGAVLESDDTYLYIALEGRAAVRVRLRYLPSPEFVRTVNKLLMRDKNVIIRSVDPNVDMDLIEQLTGISAESPVRIIKSKSDPLQGVDRTDSGMIALDGMYSLAKTLEAAAKVRNAMNAGIVFAAIAMLLGAALMIVLHVTGTFGASVTFYAALYQLFWVIPTFIIDKMMI